MDETEQSSLKPICQIPSRECIGFNDQLSPNVIATFIDNWSHDNSGASDVPSI